MWLLTRPSATMAWILYAITTLRQEARAFRPGRNGVLESQNLLATPDMNKPALATRVLRLRLKDKHAAALRAMARDVNLVWNYCNELSAKVFERERRFIGMLSFISTWPAPPGKGWAWARPCSRKWPKNWSAGASSSSA